MEYEPASKARSRKESELVGYGELANSDKPKRADPGSALSGDRVRVHVNPSALAAGVYHAVLPPALIK
jgi:hypothetical protein